MTTLGRPSGRCQRQARQRPCQAPPRGRIYWGCAQAQLARGRWGAGGGARAGQRLRARRTCAARRARPIAPLAAALLARLPAPAPAAGAPTCRERGASGRGVKHRVGGWQRGGLWWRYRHMPRHDYTPQTPHTRLLVPCTLPPWASRTTNWDSVPPASPNLSNGRRLGRQGDGRAAAAPPTAVAVALPELLPAPAEAPRSAAERVTLSGSSIVPAAGFCNTPRGAAHTDCVPTGSRLFEQGAWL